MDKNASVGVLGLGLIGAAWAKHWNDDGLLAAVWNRTAKADFPRFHSSPHEVLARSDTLVLCVADPAAVDEVLQQVEKSLEARHLVIQTSTIDPESSERFEQRVKAAGARFLAAPFTGSKPAAEARKTVFYLGGDEALRAEAEPVLARVSAHRIAIGTNAQACTLKLAMNMQIALQAEALCESYAFCRRAGIADDVFFGALRRNVAWSGLSELKEPKLRNLDFSPQFSVKHMHKDMRLAMAALSADEAPATNIICQCLARAEKAGWGDDDFVSLLRNIMEKRA